MVIRLLLQLSIKPHNMTHTGTSPIPNNTSYDHCDMQIFFHIFWWSLTSQDTRRYSMSCRNVPSAGFIFLYLFALLKLQLHIVLDGLFSLVVISDLYLIRMLCSSRINCRMWEKLRIPEYIHSEHAHIHSREHVPVESDTQPLAIWDKVTEFKSPGSATEWADHKIKLSPWC